MRTAEGLGVNKLYLTGYSPYPKTENDNRLPHISAKVTKQISKTSLGAEDYLDWEHFEEITEVLDDLKSNDFKIYGLEQSASSIDIREAKLPDKLALIVGREVEGIEKELLEQCDQVIEIPMLGKKESFNVAQAAAMALYHFCYMYT